MRNQRASDHLQSPYSRTPKSNKFRQPPQTPGSIFSKVKRMFSPSVWINDHQEESDLEPEITTTSINQNPSQFAPQVSTPANPFAEFRKLQNQPSDSPNVTLAKFFAQKGNAPLSAIEIEGVKALLSKASSPDSTINLTRSEDEDDSTNNISINESLLQNDSKRISSATPSFKATYNNKTTYVDVRSRSNTPEPVSNRKKIYDFSGFPSPYRTSRLKSSFSITDLKTESKQEEAIPIEETKKLSNTASALLSFIENSNGSDEKTNNSSNKENKFIDFSNPYAINRKAKKPIVIKKSEPSITERLEESLNEEEKNKPIQKPLPNQSFLVSKPLEINKYKPTKSSSLCESITINDDDQSMEQSDTTQDITQEEPVKSPTLLSHAPLVESTPASSFKPKDVKPQPAFSFTQPVPSIPTSMELTTTSTKLTSTSVNNNSLFSLKSNDEDEIVEDAPLFTFPNAIASNLSIQDIDEAKVRQYEALFTF